MEQKEKAGIGKIFKPTGKEIIRGFNRVWGGHRFTDEEVKLLIEGKEIKILTGNDKLVVGRLEKRKFKGKVYWGFQIGIPIKTAGHEWTGEEREKLYKGDEIYIDDFYSPKKCENFPAIAIWDSRKREINLSYLSEDDEELDDDYIDDEDDL